MIREGEYHGLQAADSLRPSARDGGDRLCVRFAPSPADRATEEQRLVARCILGEQDAWTTLFQDYHSTLVAYIKFLTPGGSREQAEETAAGVWCSFYCGMAKVLQRYDPQAGGLLRCLKHLARGEVWRRRRSERCRRLRECKVARKDSTCGDVEYGLMVQEFLATLTRREREFCLSILLSASECGVGRKISDSNEWTLRSRIMRKYRTYLLQNN